MNSKFFSVFSQTTTLQYDNALRFNYGQNLNIVSRLQPLLYYI
jgi:hypothetical protein